MVGQVNLSGWHWKAKFYVMAYCEEYLYNFKSREQA